MSSNLRRSHVAQMQAQLNQMGFHTKGHPFQMKDDSSSEEEDDNHEEMMLAQAGGDTGKKGKGNIYNEKAGIDELGTNVFTFMSPSQGGKFQRTRRQVAEYAERHYGKGQFELIMYGTKPHVEEPTKPVPDSNGKIDEVKMMEYKQDREWQKRETNRVEEQTSKLFFLVLGQAVTPLRNAIEALPEFTKVRKDRDVDALIVMMETLIQGTENKQNKFVRQWKQMKKLFKDTEQQDGEPDAIYGARLVAQAESAVKCGAVLLPESAIGLDKSEKLKMKEEFLAAGIICNANRKMHGTTINYLKDEFMGGRADIYKKTVADAVDFLSKRTKDRNSGNAGVQFAQQDGVESSSTKIYCYKCGKQGFTTQDCPKCAIDALAKASLKSKKKGKKASQYLGAFR